MEQDAGKIPGFMLATVLSNSDEEHKGRLKLRLLCEGKTKNILENVKVITPFGGERYGVYCLPEVGEQVLVGFLGGCFDMPFVFGSVYTASDPMVSESFHRENARKRLVTKGGNVVEISDEKGQETISVHTPDNKLSVELLQKEETVTVSAGRNTVTLDGKKGLAQIKTEKKLELHTGSASLTMEADGKITLKGGAVEVKGSSIKGNSNGLLNLKGQSCEMSGTMVNLKSSGIMQIKGSVTKIN